MTKKEVGESLIQIGALMLIMPCIVFFIVSALFLVSLIEFGIVGIIALCCLAYLGISIGLILYGRKISK